VSATVEHTPSVVVEPRKTAIPLRGSVPWVVREAIAPRLWTKAEASGLQDLWMESNGSEGCYGGWELRFPVEAREGDQFFFELAAETAGLARGVDALVAEAFWHDAAGAQVDWDPVFFAGTAGPDVLEVGDVSGGRLYARHAVRLRCPAGATELRVRCGIRWSPAGRVRWHGWRLRPVPAAPARRLRLGVASTKPGRWVDLWTNRDHYVAQCRRAGEAGLGLVCLPELILTLGRTEKTPEDVHHAALPVPGAWLEPFQDAARRYRMGICFSTYERAGEHGEVVYNTAVLLGQGGDLIGKYRKVHLALAEARNGITAGHEFPVFDFHGIGVGMLICMDSSPAESTRILARRGAEIMLMPIAGDFRANDWKQRGERGYQFDEDRWRLIQRVHAIDNHLFTAVARNNTQGSNVTAPWGEILAYDGGREGVIWADVNVDDRRRHPTGSTMQSVLWSMRRPYTYGALADATLPAQGDSDGWHQSVAST
jgi:predicted amidohydrolase